MTIQKYKPVYEHGNITIQRAPFTQLYNKVLQTCTNLEAIAIWSYLQSQPDNWELSPNQLRNHFKICKDKLYKILTYMIGANLLVRHVQKSEKGTHLNTSYTVLDGTNFLCPERRLDDCAQESAPLPEKQDPVLQDPEKQDITKERDLKKKEYTKEISNNNCASDDARVQNEIAFDEFWKQYPVKKNKVRAKKIWDKNKLYEIFQIILRDIMQRRTKDSQWQNTQYIPHPSSYLGNKLWNDDIQEVSNTNKSSNTSRSSSFDEYLADLKKQGGHTYEHCAISQ